ncbi:hypothetical protein U732_1140 [Clostridium argentinense CDC 2741]|uniref:SIR2-like domain protein n=1 Tax=Clostridium argentinense CDC 2741 TaxID=1418104 RepID=A0A0C1R9V8_9CLOT|nr:hypothetical protein [Clostridium argentinense]ARC85626.1 hypothetical protein RSJ17_14490 [Clostridium argentinense]KIE47231.1 hypothetical protein U732_1140 [Clostridium argentinense CDC 2741]NFF40853.1 hypothetical protein [Clostridium argentinense]NFP50785.1 hypothetical protein [Clostridium argentinense]NFP73058.1 hypothetical protein [Clostridium argentinense]
MIERNVLIGNGINIAFSENDDYKNFKIIERLIQNLEAERYKDVFEGSVDSYELLSVLTGLNNEFKKMMKGTYAIRWTENEDEIQTLIEMSKRYNNKPLDVLDVGMEDYFFAMKLFNNRFREDAIPINLLFDGLKWIFLDTIYNNGKIETLYSKMGCYAKELSLYKDIFTVNYDTNLDKLTEKCVYHLHGDFETLDDTYIPETLLGYLSQQNDNPPKIIPSMKHIYCNAIMGFSGDCKMNDIKVYSNGNMAMDSIVARIQNPLDAEVHQKFMQLKNSTNENEISIAKSIVAKLEYPELRHTEYPIEQFKSINGELHIIGMSPNNDSHIFKMINENPNIRNVVYFSASDTDSLSAKKVIQKPLQVRNVFEYWEKIKSK